MNNTSDTVINTSATETKTKVKGKHGRTMGATSYVVVNVEDLSNLPVGTKLAISRVQARSLNLNGQPFTPNPQAFKALNQTAVAIKVEAVAPQDSNPVTSDTTPVVVAEDNTPAL